MGTIRFSTSYFFPLLHWVKREEGKESLRMAEQVWGTAALPGPAAATGSGAAGLPRFRHCWRLPGRPALARDGGGNCAFHRQLRIFFVNYFLLPLHLLGQ